jgi:hypothetical protein
VGDINKDIFVGIKRENVSYQVILANVSKALDDERDLIGLHGPLLVVDLGRHFSKVIKSNPRLC